MLRFSQPNKRRTMVPIKSPRRRVWCNLMESTIKAGLWQVVFMLDFPKRRKDEEERIQFAFMLPNEISAPGSIVGIGWSELKVTVSRIRLQIHVLRCTGLPGLDWVQSDPNGTRLLGRRNSGRFVERLTGRWLHISGGNVMLSCRNCLKPC